MVAEDHPVREVLKKVVEDQSIDQDQVRTLEQFVKGDWVIDPDEAELLFKVNRALASNHDDCKEWTEFFVTSISRLVVLDMNSPGEIDESEGDWLAGMLDEFGIENESQKKLIHEIQKHTSSISGKLGERFQSFD